MWIKCLIVVHKSAVIKCRECVNCSLNKRVIIKCSCKRKSGKKWSGAWSCFCFNESGTAPFKKKMCVGVYVSFLYKFGKEGKKLLFFLLGLRETNVTSRKIFIKVISLTSLNFMGNYWTNIVLTYFLLLHIFRDPYIGILKS